MKHTPGPWRVDPNAPRYVLAGSGGISIGLASTVDVSESMSRSNARLIAAAPELLEALKLVEFGHAVTQYKCVACAGWDMGPNGETPRKHTPKCPVGNAIAKAEGNG